MRKRLDEAEANLAATYMALVDDYGRWKLALDDLDNIWALAVWRFSVADEPVETEGRRAA